MLKKRVTSPLIQEGDKVMALQGIKKNPSKMEEDDWNWKVSQRSWKLSLDGVVLGGLTLDSQVHVQVVKEEEVRYLLVSDG